MSKPVENTFAEYGIHQKIIAELDKQYPNHKEDMTKALKKLLGEEAGTKHDAGKPSLALLPANAIFQIGEVMTYGAKKYGAHNYLGGLSYLRLSSACLRHLFSWLRGEDLDPESGLSHVAHAAASLCMLIEMTARKPELDDRYKAIEPEAR